MERVLIYDTTLRDGQQMEGMSLSVGEQLQVAVRLAEMGVEYIEAGFPSSNPKDSELFDLLEQEDLGGTQVAAFGMTRRRALPAEEDPGLRVLVDCFAPVTTIVGKTWDVHIEKVIRVTREENLKMIEESVAFLVRHGKAVIYDAEHFFDAYRAHPDYALDCLKAAAAGGAAWLTPATPTAPPCRARWPGSWARSSRRCPARGSASTPTTTPSAAWPTPGRGRAGRADGAGHRQRLRRALRQRQPRLDHPGPAAQDGLRALEPERLPQLTELSNFVAETANLRLDNWAPYVGRNAFAHKGGMHVQGIMADVTAYEHIAPELVGNGRRTPVSEQSGRSTIISKARELGLDVDSDTAVAAGILERLKELEHRGYHFEVADASFELLVERELGGVAPLFTLESFRVTTYKRADGRVETEATVKLIHEGDRLVAVGEGNGPVNALDAALRSALVSRIPELAAIELVNFKVRILDERTGSAATTRVLIDSTDGHGTWGTIGVSENVIAASWEALVDSLEYGVRHRARTRTPAA